MNHINEQLLHAVQTGKVDAVRVALEYKGNPNYIERDGYTLLHFATQEGFVEIAGLLVSFGADVNSVDDNDMTPLYNAAGNNDFEMVKELIDLGANVNNTQRIGAALHNAVAWENTEIVDLLLASGADVDVVDDEGRTPLFFAVLAENANLAALLISHGADKNVRNKEGKTPLDLAREKKDEAVARFEAMSNVLTGTTVTQQHEKSETGIL